MAKVEVIYIAEDGTLFQRHLPFQEGSTVGELVAVSGLYERYPACRHMSHGIFATAVTRDTPVKAGDRIEIYRPLQVDPMKKRRLRAKQKP
ncbi:MAG: RnfH family protein [Legionellaceae bacterium]|nr:RnfH family protein [Legionellaceae bacterium]